MTFQRETPSLPANVVLAAESYAEEIAREPKNIVLTITDAYLDGYTAAIAEHKAAAKELFCEQLGEVGFIGLRDAAAIQKQRDDLVAVLLQALQLKGGWREAIVELEDFCSEPVRLKNMIAAADQIDAWAKSARELIDRIDPGRPVPSHGSGP